MAWRLAKSLVKLREQVNAAYPSRSKISDGSIGDQLHASRASDHNPDNLGRVTAIDITHDPANGVDGQKLSNQLIADKRAKYVIFAGRIWKARTGQWEPYRGSNRHDKHVHISVTSEMADYDSPWDIARLPDAPTQPTLRLGSKGQDVRLLQEKLSVPIDGVFGPKTAASVEKFQRQQGLTADGVVGAATWKALNLK